MKTNRHKGVGLILVIVVMAVLVILGATILTVSLAETKVSVYQDKRVQAYYLAKSGVDSVSTYILAHPGEAMTIAKAPESNVNSHFTNGTFKVDVSNHATDSSLGSNEVRVKGIGAVGEVENSSSVVLQSLSLPDILDKAIYSKNSLDISNMKVTGDIQSAGNIQYRTNGSNQYNGTAYANSPREIEFVAPFPAPGTTNMNIKNSSSTITTSGYYKDITVGQKGVLNVITNGSNLEIVVDNLTIDSNLFIDATAGGSVIIYVNNSMTVNTKGQINNTESKNLFIYLKSGSILSMQANKVLNGYIIGPEATVEVQSNQSTVNGAIFSKIVQKNGAGSGPNGVVNYVPLTNGSAGVGSVVPTEYKIVRWEK